MTTITLYNKSTGELGPVLTAQTKEELVIPEGYGYFDGQLDVKAHTLDLATMQLVDRVPPPPRLGQLRDKRNRLLDSWRWTVMPDSPLANQGEWLTWLQTLQCLLRDVTDETTSSVVWPTQPPLVYPE